MRLFPILPHTHFRQQRHIHFPRLLHNFRQLLPSPNPAVIRHFQHQFIVHLHNQLAFKAV